MRSHANEGLLTGAGLCFPRQSRSVALEKPREAGKEAAADIAQLTSRMAGHDEAAYRMFYELYFNRLLRYLLVVTSGREGAAREALQSTMLRVVRHARRFDSEEAFWSWLTVLARSSVVDAERKRSRYAALLERFFRQEPEPDEVRDGAAESRLRELLEKNLTVLGVEDRALIEQKYFGEKSVRNIAVETGATESAIESRLVRVRRRLREAILSALKNEE